MLRAATEAGVSIPKLCATDSLAAFGSCRMCLVEVEGGKGVPASCTTPCADGMVVSTQTETVRELRRNVMELYLSDHPEDCDGCARGNCEIQALADQVGSAEVRYGRPETREEVAHPQPVDESNPYFAFDASSCIVCSRCVRACSDIQGTFALTVEGRGFDSKISAGGTDFLSSECVSCGACVQACPTSALQEHSIVQLGMPTRSVETTCAYCGVGCSFRAEVKGEGADAEVVRMIPSKDGGANEGHSCVKGRFAYGYAAHKDRQLSPMVRDTIDDEWRKVSWDEAIAKVATGFQALQAEHGVGSIGGISSSRCTNEEVYVVQKMVRAAFGNNNIDTCARVCHSPTGYGLKQTFGTSAGTQDFRSVDQADVILLIGANPTDAHPVFASRMKRRLREGAELIVADPRRIDLVRSPHVEAAHHLPGAARLQRRLRQRDGPRHRHRGPPRRGVRPRALRGRRRVPRVHRRPGQLAPRPIGRGDRGGPRAGPRRGPALRRRRQRRDLLRARRHRALPGLDDGDGHGQPGHGHRQHRSRGRRREPAPRPEQRAGLLRHGLVPPRVPGLPARLAGRRPRHLRAAVGQLTLDPEPGLRIPNMFDSALAGTFRGLYIQGEDIAQSDPNTQHVEAALRAMDLVVVQDLFLNETARFAHVFLPGTSFLEKDGTFTNAERRINRVRPVFPSKVGMDEWEITCAIGRAMGYDMSYAAASEIMDEVAATTPTFAGVSFARLDEVGSMQWPVYDTASTGTPIMHIGEFVRGKGKLIETVFVPTTERSTRKFPLILTTGRILSQYNVGAQTRRTANNTWHPEDVLEIHPADAELRGISTGDLVDLTSRVGSTTLRAEVSERMPAGVVYTTFHHPVTGANVVTTENSDWATNCPEYKVTAVQVGVANARGDAAVAEERQPAETHA